MAGNQQAASLFQQSPVIEASVGSMDKTKSPWYKLFYKFKEINVMVILIYQLWEAVDLVTL